MAFQLLMGMERAMFGHLHKDGSIEDYEKKLGKQAAVLPVSA